MQKQNSKSTETQKPENTESKKHGFKPSYAGPSPTVRGHERKLTPVRLDYAAGSVTERDLSFIRDMRASYGKLPFKRYDADAGNMGRAIAHGYLVHVNGDLATRDCQFQLTDTGYQAGKPVTAK